MKNELEAKQVLSVFDKIRQHGEAHDGTYLLEGVKAYTDHDGYTVFLEDALVQLRYGFHNQYHFEYQTNEHLEQFKRKLEVIQKDY